MANKFRDLLEAMPKERQESIEKRKIELLQGIRIKELRKLNAVTQAEMAKTLSVQQPSISKIEKQDDMLISTLRDYLAGLGAHLKLVAEFPDYELPLEFLNKETSGKEHTSDGAQ